MTHTVPSVRYILALRQKGAPVQKVRPRYTGIIFPFLIAVAFWLFLFDLAVLGGAL